MTYKESEHPRGGGGRFAKKDRDEHPMRLIDNPDIMENADGVEMDLGTDPYSPESLVGTEVRDMDSMIELNQKAGPGRGFIWGSGSEDGSMRVIRVVNEPRIHEERRAETLLSGVMVRRGADISNTWDGTLDEVVHQDRDYNGRVVLSYRSGAVDVHRFGDDVVVDNTQTALASQMRESDAQVMNEVADYMTGGVWPDGKYFRQHEGALRTEMTTIGYTREGKQVQACVAARIYPNEKLESPEGVTIEEPMHMWVESNGISLHRIERPAAGVTEKDLAALRHIDAKHQMSSGTGQWHHVSEHAAKDALVAITRKSQA